jgi:23S rRNA (cytosine1962-C5)-methyltransferase
VALRERVFGEDAAVRLVHGEADLLPGLVVDRYGDVAVMQTLVPATDRRKGAIADMLWNAFRLRCVVERNDVRVRELEGLPLVKGLVRGVQPGVIEYREGEVRLRIDPLHGQKTGAFLDQRENHLRAGEYAAGRCLDCFSYGGGFALQLARRAEQVIAVEIQAPAAQVARENAALNRAANVEVVEANAFDYLRERERERAAFDMIVLDPPAFAKSRASLTSALRGYHEINLRAMRLLAPGGFLYTASCSYHLTKPIFLEMLEHAAADSGRRMALRDLVGQPLDHPELLTIPETGYIKGAILEAMD